MSNSINNDDTTHLHSKVKEILYSLTGITLAENKDVMISNRLYKLKRDTKFDGGDLKDLLKAIEKGSFTTEFINSFTTNKTHFFRECFHFEDLRDRVLPVFANTQQQIKMYCSASSTGEEPYSMAMTVIHTKRALVKNINASIIATDIDTNVLKYASNGIYRFSKSSKEFPPWISPSRYFKRRIEKKLGNKEILIKAKDELKKLISFRPMNLNDSSYPYLKHEFDVIFCRNVLIYFSVEDQNKILKKLFLHLKIGGTLYLGHSENPNDLINYVEKIGPNIFIKTKDLS